MMKKNWCCSENMAAVGLLALRIAVGVIFINHGWMKLQDMEMTTKFFESLNIPLAGFAAWVVALVEFVGGIAVLLGIYTKEVAKLLVINMIVALLVAHISGPFARAELAIALLGGSLALSGLGAGPWRLIKKESCCLGKGGCGGKCEGNCSCGTKEMKK